MSLFRHSKSERSRFFLCGRSRSLRFSCDLVVSRDESLRDLSVWINAREDPSLYDVVVCLDVLFCVRLASFFCHAVIIECDNSVDTQRDSWEYHYRHDCKDECSEAQIGSLFCSLSCIWSLICRIIHRIFLVRVTWVASRRIAAWFVRLRWRTRRFGPRLRCYCLSWCTVPCDSRKCGFRLRRSERFWIVVSFLRTI